MQEMHPFQLDQSIGTIEQMREARFGDDILLQRESILTKTSSYVLEEDWLDVEMNQLYKFALLILKVSVYKIL